MIDPQPYFAIVAGFSDGSVGRALRFWTFFGMWLRH